MCSPFQPLQYRNCSTLLLQPLWVPSKFYVMKDHNIKFLLFLLCYNTKGMEGKEKGKGKGNGNGNGNGKEGKGKRLSDLQEIWLGLEKLILQNISSELILVNSSYCKNKEILILRHCLRFLVLFFCCCCCLIYLPTYSKIKIKIHYFVLPSYKRKQTAPL